MDDNWCFGNAVEDGPGKHGWLLGHFFDPTQGIRWSKDVEVKWGIHPVREKRAAWTVGDRRTALTVLIEGRFRIDLSEQSITMEKPGDYVIWGPGIDHSWEALADSVVVTVRWPSVAL